MDAVVNPTASPATMFIDQNDRNREGYTGKDAAALAGMHILNDIHTGSAAGIRETAEVGRHNIRETSEVGRFNMRETSDATRHLADLVTRNLSELKNVDIHNADRTRALLDEILEADMHNSERTGKLVQDIERNFAQTRVEMVSGFKESLLDSAKNTAAIQLEACKNAAAIALAQATNTAAIQAAIADCCCEQKELTRAEAETTRQLINSLNTQNLQSDLADAKAKVQLLQLGVKIAV